jgi:shikimate kinase
VSGPGARVLLLVGPKGAGKTTIAEMLARRADAHFVEAEAISKRVLAACDGVIDESYARRAFTAIADEVDRLAAAGQRLLVLETTGASDEAPAFFARLRARHDLRLVRIHAGLATCVERIATRDTTRQIAVPDDLVRRMHERTEALRLAWDLELVNDPPLDEGTVVEAFVPLLGGDRATGGTTAPDLEDS